MNEEQREGDSQEGKERERGGKEEEKKNCRRWRHLKWIRHDSIQTPKGLRTGLRIQINPGTNGVSGLFDPGVVQRRPGFFVPKGWKPVDVVFSEK